MMMEDPMVTCPFDESHRFTRKRIQFHIVKCSKNQSMAGKYKCPFNSTHIVPANEILTHVKECDSAAKVQNQYLLRKERKCFSGEVTMAELQMALDEILPENDDWKRKHELNRPGPAYDPEAVSATRAVYRPHVTMLESKAKREKLRIQERQRYNALADELTSAPQPLRRPKTVSIVAGLTKEDLETKTDEINERERKPSKKQTQSNSQPEATTSKSVNSSSVDDLKNLELTNDGATKTFQELEKLEEQEKSIRNQRNELLLLIQSDPLNNNVDYPKIAADLDDLRTRNRKLQEQKTNLIESLKKIATGINKSETNNVSNGAIKKVYETQQKNNYVVVDDGDSSSSYSSTSTKSNEKTDKKNLSPAVPLNDNNRSSPPSYAAKVSLSNNNSNKNKDTSPNTRPNRRCAANFDPTTSTDHQAWEKVGSKPQCGRGIIHAFRNANSPNVGTSRQPRS